MKGNHLLALLIFLGSICPQSDIEEAYKMPHLLMHYWQSHAEISFLEFLSLHYHQNSTHKKEDIAHHEKLPLQTSDAHSHLLAFVFIGFSWSYHLSNDTIEYPASFFSFEEDYSYLRICTLLQPPRA
ncbi:MAG: hypothetical protein EAZ55_06345 [Cytophagales bacterium]|nr:MAG: hypothetical protein EAZ55_06345 [Cytophagales bacterium]